MPKITIEEVAAIRLRWRGSEHIAAWRRLPKPSRDRVVAELDELGRAESDDAHRVALGAAADALDALGASHEGDVLRALHEDLGRLLEILEEG